MPANFIWCFVFKGMPNKEASRMHIKFGSSKWLASSKIALYVFQELDLFVIVSHGCLEIQYIIFSFVFNI